MRPSRSTRALLRLQGMTCCASAALLVVACGKSPSQPDRSAAEPRAAPAVSGGTSNAANAAAVPLRAPNRAIPTIEPTRLAELPISAYATTLAVDDDAAYLLAPRGAYRLVPGEPIHGIELELGTGPTLTRSAFVFWSDGGIWKAPKAGGTTRRIAKLPLRPQYFVSSGEDIAWVSLGDDGVYAIQTLAGEAAKTLVTGTGELSALDMVQDTVYFVDRPTLESWRLGAVRKSGGAVAYSTARNGRRPALLTGTDALYYYDVDQFKVRKVSLDLGREDDLASGLVCSPLHVARGIYCGSVEGLFEIERPSNRPRVLSYGRPGSITNIQSDARRVVWTVDLGPERLAVELLPALGPDGKPVPPG